MSDDTDLHGAGVGGMLSSAIGFIGTGAITDAMVRGLLAEPAIAARILVSSRNADIAARLAADFSGVTVAGNNQAIVDECETVVLAIRPQIAEEVVRPLTFRPGQTVISVIAATGRPKLEAWIGADVTLVQAIPLPFVSRRKGVTALYPPHAGVAALFEALGGAVSCDTKEEYDLLAVASALMASYFGIMDRATGWLTQNGLPAEKARAYLAPLFAELSNTALAAASKPFGDLMPEFATKGGLNEQVFSDFERNGGTEAMTRALDRVFARITGQANETAARR